MSNEALCATTGSPAMVSSISGQRWAKVGHRVTPASDLYSLGCLIHEERYALAAIIPNTADTYAAR